MIADSGREPCPRMGGQIGPVDQPGRDAGAPRARGGHQHVQTVDPSVGSGEGRDQPWIVGAAEAICPQRDQQAVGDVGPQGEDGVPGEGEDGLQPGAPRCHAPPAAVGIGEPAGSRGGDQPGNGVVGGHAAHRTDPGLRAAGTAGTPALGCDTRGYWWSGRGGSGGRRLEGRAEMSGGRAAGLARSASTASRTAVASWGSRPSAQSAGEMTTSTSGSTPWFSTPQPYVSSHMAYFGTVIVVPSTSRNHSSMPITPPQVRAPTTGPSPRMRSAAVIMSPSEPANSSVSATTGPRGTSCG